MCNLRYALKLFINSFSTRSTLGVKYDLITALCSQIFEYLNEKIDSCHALEHLQSCNLRVQQYIYEKSCSSRRKRLAIIDVFKGLDYGVS